ncbi:nuclear transport factor 2 family protein [Pedobacter sp.]|uniref:nuclear transport factor 2 family protein n=1 Tax=Pedobacter sp. TaxID=1411316 RepID=UPI003D7F6BB0
MMIKRFTLTICYVFGLLSFTQAQDKNQVAHLEPRYQPKPYVPESPELYQTIVALDSIYFQTYNTCDLEKMASMTDEDLEFYHDRGGLSTSKAEYLASIKQNICGKVHRVLTKGSIEVYPIQGYGAVEIGYHSFKNLVEKGQSEPSKFIVIWKLKDGNWKMSRVVSLH